MSNSFDSFNFSIKFFEENKGVEELSDFIVSFDSKLVELENIHDTDLIANEMNLVSSKLFKYGAIYESQNKVVQQIEDDYDMWYMKHYVKVSEDYKGLKEKEKEAIIKVKNEEEYKAKRQRILDEQYKLGLVKRVCNSLESYSMKLHAILKHTETKK